MMHNIYESAPYRRSRRAYTAQSAFEYFAQILVGDAFMAKLLSYLGLSDGTIGVITSISTFAFLFQLASIFLLRFIKNIKRTVIFFNCMCELLFMLLYLIPFLPGLESFRTPLILLVVLFGYFCSYFVSSILFKWANSFVDPEKRAEYSAVKEMISLISGAAVTLSSGYIIDRFEGLGNLRGAFLFCAVSIAVFCFVNFLCLIMIPSPPESEQKAEVSPGRVFSYCFGKKQFRDTIFLAILYNAATYTTIGFMGIYKTKDLMFSVGAVQLIGLCGTASRFFLSKPFGRYSDRHSFARGIRLACTFSAAGFFIGTFCSPSRRFLIIIYTILLGVAGAGTNANFSNIVYNCVEPEYFAQASAIKNSIGGIFGFLSSLLASRILETIRQNGNMLLGVPLHGQQLLSFISFILMTLVILFTKKRLEPASDKKK